MESEILNLALSQGIWAVISVFLILYILRTQEKRDTSQSKREESYQKIISELTEKLNLIDDIKKDVESIKDIVLKSK